MSRDRILHTTGSWCYPRMPPSEVFMMQPEDYEKAYSFDLDPTDNVYPIGIVEFTYRLINIVNTDRSCGRMGCISRETFANSRFCIDYLPMLETLYVRGLIRVEKFSDGKYYFSLTARGIELADANCDYAQIASLYRILSGTAS